MTTTEQARRRAADRTPASAGDQAPVGGESAGVAVDHHVPTDAGLVSLSWHRDQRVFVAVRGQQVWSDRRLGDLARTVGMRVPADVAWELRRAERLPETPSTQRRPVSTSHPDARPHTEALPDASVPAVESRTQQRPSPETYAVPSRHGSLTVAWDAEDRCFTARSASGNRWRADHLDDLAIKAGARIPSAYVDALLRDAGRPVPTYDRPAGETTNEWQEWQPASVAVPSLIDSLPPGVAEGLKPAVAAPSRSEPGGVARVEAARRAVRAEWGAWADEAAARRRLIEDLSSVMQGLARGDLVHQAVQRLAALAERNGRQADLERSPTIGAHARAGKESAAAVDRLHSLRSRPQASTAAVGPT